MRWSRILFLSAAVALALGLTPLEAVAVAPPTPASASPGVATSATPTATPTPSPSQTPSPTPTPTPSPTPTPTPTPTPQLPPPSLSPATVTFSPTDTAFVPVSVVLNGASITAIRVTDGFIAATAAPDLTCSVGTPKPGPDACRVSVKLGSAFPALGSLTIDTTEGPLVVALKVAGVWVPNQPVSRRSPFVMFGGGFAPGTSITVLWDGTALGSLSTNADGTWSFTFGVPASAGNDPHQVCVVASPSNICTTVTVEAAIITASPSPSPSSPASPSPSPAGSPGASTPPADGGATGGISLVATITRPPFVFFPIALVAGLLGLLAWFAIRAYRRGELDPLDVEEPSQPLYQPAPEPEPLPPAAPEPVQPPPTVVHYETPGAATPRPAAPAPPPDDADLPPDLPEPSD